MLIIMEKIPPHCNRWKVESKTLINLQIKAVNDAPLASNSLVQTEEGRSVSFELNATDVENDSITYRVINSPKHGTLTVDKNGKCKYVPFENYNGKDSFSFRASDRDSDGNLGVVTLEITPKNEAPQVMDATFALEEDGKLPIKLSLPIQTVTPPKWSSNLQMVL